MNLFETFDFITCVPYTINKIFRKQACINIISNFVSIASVE